MVSIPGKTREQIQAEIQAKEQAMEQLCQKYSSESVSSDEIRRCLRSISDNDSFLKSSRDPVERMIQYLTTFWDPQKADPGFSLAITYGKNGARLTHDHTTQYYYVLQSLTLWRAVLNDMFKLWITAEEDLLDPENRYRLLNTGQGLNRVQSVRSWFDCFDFLGSTYCRSHGQDSSFRC